MSENTEDSKTDRLTALTPNARFVAADEDMLAAEAEYQEFERELQSRIDNIEHTKPGYAEYSYHVQRIWHDPYVLIAILSARKPDFKISDPEIRELMSTLKEPRRQYTLTTTPREGNTLDVKLINYDLNCVMDSILDHDEMCAYAAYLRSHGMRPDLFPVSKYPDASQPAESPKYDFDYNLVKDSPPHTKLIRTAEQFINFPYVWSGHTPETSFDCAGFVEYCMNQAGWQIGHETVQGVFDYCEPITEQAARPGDLVFFSGTWNTDRMSHVGIYLGSNTMINACVPIIRYSNLNDHWKHRRMRWVDFEHIFARLPLQPKHD